MSDRTSKFKPGETVTTKSPRVDGYILITLIKYVPKYEWFAEYYDPQTNELKKDYFDEREFD